MNLIAQKIDDFYLKNLCRFIRRFLLPQLSPQMRAEIADDCAKGVGPIVIAYEAFNDLIVCGECGHKHGAHNREFGCLVVVSSEYQHFYCGCRWSNKSPETLQPITK